MASKIIRRRNRTKPAQTQNIDDAKRAVLDKAVGDILKRYGDGSIMRLGEAHGMVTEAIPTGSLSLDIALGVGGIPRGRITEIYGPESSGKTTLCQHIVAEAQKTGRHRRLHRHGTCPRPGLCRARAAWILTTCSSPSPIPANRRSRSPRPSCAPARWMWSSSTRLPRSSPAPKSKATWAMPPWVCRPV